MDRKQIIRGLERRIKEIRIGRIARMGFVDVPCEQWIEDEEEDQ